MVRIRRERPAMELVAPPECLRMGVDAESREQSILRQRLGDDGAPQQRACRPAYISAHYIVTAATWSTAADLEGRERAELCGYKGVGWVGSKEGSHQTSRHYASTSAKLR